MTSTRLDDVLASIDEGAETDLDGLFTLVRQPSISAQNVGVRECAELVRDFMHDAGLTTRLLETSGHPMVYGEWLGALSQGALALVLNRWIEQRFDLPPPDLPDLSQETDPEAAAASLRQQWRLGEAPVRNMIHLLEAKGVRVYSLAVDSLNVDAYSQWHDDTPMVFLNLRKSAERSRFDAAHELGHLLLHRHARKEDTRLAEDEANRFASALLMPRNGTLARAARFVTIQHLIAHKKHWIVSVAALNHRLHELGVTNPWQYRHLSAEIGKRGYRTNEPDPAPHESSQLLSKVFAALREDSLSQRRIAAELNLPSSELEQLIFGLTMTSLDGGMKRVASTSASPVELKVVDRIPGGV